MHCPAILQQAKPRLHFLAKVLLRNASHFRDAVEGLPKVQPWLSTTVGTSNSYLLLTIVRLMSQQFLPPQRGLSKSLDLSNKTGGPWTGTEGQSVPSCSQRKKRRPHQPNKKLVLVCRQAQMPSSQTGQEKWDTNLPCAGNRP